MAEITIPTYTPAGPQAAGVQVALQAVANPDTGSWTPTASGFDLLLYETASVLQTLTMVTSPATLGRVEQPSSTGSDLRRILGPFPKLGFARGDGKIDLSFSSGDGGDLAVISVPRTSRYGGSQPSETGVVRAVGFRTDVMPYHIAVPDGDLIAILSSGEGSGATFASSGLDLIFARATSGATGVRVSGQPDAEYGRSDDLPVTTLAASGEWYVLGPIPQAGFADSIGDVTVYTTADAAEFFVVALG